jgi:uncharacterized protein (TIGR03083 family)
VAAVADGGVGLAQRSALIAQLEALEPGDWHVVTECDPWTVRDIAAHIAGELVWTRNPFAYATLVASWLRHYRGRSFLDGTNEAAVRARRDWTTGQLLDVLRRDAPRAVVPAWARPLPLAGVANLPRYATFGYLADVVLPRDCFMHRHDVARATGRAVAFDPSDTEVVAQVVRDLQRAWRGPALTLRLNGPAGGTWRLGAGDAAAGPIAELDAVEFLRQLSGRDTDPTLFDQLPDTLRNTLVAARITF